MLGALVTTTAPSAGLAVGALGTSAIVQYAPGPTHLVWWLVLGAFVVALVAVRPVPEPGTRRPGGLASLRPRVTVPQEARGMFAVTAPCLIASWALGGFYLALGPSLATGMVGSRDRLWGGLVIFLLFGFGAAASVLLRSLRPATAMLAGCLALLAGAAVTFAAIATATAAAFLLGTAVAGTGFGLGFRGAFRMLVAVAAPNDHARLIAAIYAVVYLAYGIPALVAGVATSHFGLHDTALVYSPVIAALVAAAAGSLLFHRGAPSLPPEHVPVNG